MHLRLAEQLEQPQDPRRFVDDQRRVRAGGELPGLAVAEPLGEVAGHHDADQLVELSAAYGVARVAAGAYGVPHRLAIVGGIEPDDVAAWNHDAAHRAVRQAQDALDHLVLGHVEDAGVGRLGDHGTDLLLAHGAVRRRAYAEGARDQLGRALQHPDEGLAEDRERLHERREARASGLVSAQRFGTSSPTMSERKVTPTTTSP